MKGDIILNKFDQQIKCKAQSENFDVPYGFSERIDNMTGNLIMKEKNKKTRKPRCFLAVATILLVMTSAVTFASPILVDMVEGTVSYFNAPKEFRYMSKQSEYEKYNAEVDISCQDQGIGITLDNIAVDDNYINVFYTLKSENPIDLLGSGEEPENWRLRWTAPNFWYKVDGRYIEPAAENEIDAYLVDEYTLKGMQRFTLLGQLKDNFNLEMYSDWILNTNGKWHIAMNIDKSNVATESKTIMPNINATVTSGWEENIHNHKINIKKVSISPFGSQIVISERGENTFYNFAIRDDQGNYLPIVPKGSYGSALFKVDNSFEFIPKSENMQSLSIIPIKSDGHSELNYFDLPTDLPKKLQVNELGGYVLESIQIDANKMIAIVHQDGAVPVMHPSLIPSDKNGGLLHYAGHGDEEYDRETGAITLTYYWTKDITEEDLGQIAGLSYFTNYDFELSEQEAITIKLKQ